MTHQPSQFAEELIAIEHEGGLLLAYIQDLEISLHDVVNPELNKLIEDVRLLPPQPVNDFVPEKLIVDSPSPIAAEAPTPAVVQREQTSLEIQLAAELRRVKSSISWRITAPLRFVRHRLRGAGRAR